ncbi:hypothetical protein [Limosilactobacillus sp. DJ3M12]|uniref:hypothetical protein n=1 Tax=Limosilactobacillus sp. DJ3M12 TaxID=2991835 RepID=UPI0024B99A06|nr:hypothetical protein [Limosilactobacillus sp. DJ3M12]
MEKRLLQDGGVLPSQIENENIYDLFRITKARNREDRPLSSFTAHQRLRHLSH